MKSEEWRITQAFRFDCHFVHQLVHYFHYCLFDVIVIADIFMPYKLWYSTYLHAETRKLRLKLQQMTAKIRFFFKLRKWQQYSCDRMCIESRQPQ